MAAAWAGFAGPVAATSLAAPAEPDRAATTTVTAAKRRMGPPGIGGADRAAPNISQVPTARSPSSKMLSRDEWLPRKRTLTRDELLGPHRLGGRDAQRP